MQQYRKNLGKVSLTSEGAWSREKSYEILSIVYDEHTQRGFISRQNVPQGIDLYNKEYWMPFNVSGYADNNMIILADKVNEHSIKSYTLEEAILSIAQVGRRPGAILGFYNENADRLDIGGRWELWQFNDTNIYNWENVTSWQSLYYNYNKFVGWFENEDFLVASVMYPEIGCYAFVGSELNEATIYRCDSKHVWHDTTQHAWDYVKINVGGNVTIGENGNWFNNGVDTKIPATVKGENGKTPLIRNNNNVLEYSYDNKTWTPISDKIAAWFRLKDNKIQISQEQGVWTDVSDYVAAWFRWQATAADTQANNIGRLQISRDGKTWQTLSPDISNNLHISRYIAADASLPTSGIAEGTIYAKGPTYAEDDANHDYPKYRLWVYAWKDDTLAWQDNGEFTSIAAGVTQTTGDSETEVMSQKAVTEKLSELGSKVFDNTIFNAHRFLWGNEDYTHTETLEEAIAAAKEAKMNIVARGITYYTDKGVALALFNSQAKESGWDNVGNWIVLSKETLDMIAKNYSEIQNLKEGTINDIEEIKTSLDVFGVKQRTNQLFDKDNYKILKNATIKSSGELLQSGEMSIVYFKVENLNELQYNFKFFVNDGSMYCKGVFAFKNEPSFGQIQNTDFIKGTHAVSGSENRGFITIPSAGYNYLAVWLDDGYDNRFDVIDSLCVVQSSNYPTEPSTLLPYSINATPSEWVSKNVNIKTIGGVSENQGVDNAGKTLVVKQDGKVGLGESSESANLEEVVKRVESIKIPISDNLVSNAPTNDSWSYSNGVYTHIGGTNPLVFSNNPTISGRKYVVRLTLGTNKEDAISVSVGDKPSVDVYNGKATSIVGFVSDGGYLKITPNGSFKSTVVVELYEVVDEESAKGYLVFESNNVWIGSPDNGVTNWWNVALGTNRTFMNAESATRCIAIGNEALSNFITGTRNIAIGTYAAQSLLSGEENIAIGADSLYGESSTHPLVYADRCVAIGKKAMGGRTQNIESVAVGNYSMMSDNVSHIESTAIGRGACQMATENITEVRENASLGYLANFYANSNNTSIGAYSSYKTRGTNNVAVGRRSFYDNSGSNNVFVGSDSGCSTDVNGAIAIGHQAKATKSNQMVLGNQNITEVIIAGKKIIFNSDGTCTWESV